MKSTALRNVCHASAKGHNIDPIILGRHVGKFHKVEHSEMKQNYVETSVARLSIPKYEC